MPCALNEDNTIELVWDQLNSVQRVETIDNRTALLLASLDDLLDDPESELDQKPIEGILTPSIESLFPFQMISLKEI
ncbi:hypothetical protein HED51_02985 [Ochrobactrum grignonense]|nr:hypothetical protein [Brucella grignonensis]